MRIRVPWWVFPLDTLSFVVIFIPAIFIAAAKGPTGAAVVLPLPLIASLALNRTMGWTLTSDAVKVHPGLFRKSVDIPWADIQAVVSERAMGAWTLAFWTDAGLAPEQLSRGPNLRGRRAEQIRARIEETWVARRGADWQPLPGPWNPESPQTYDFGPDPFAPPQP